MAVPHKQADGPAAASGAGAPERPQVNSFDVFDTLIARRCVQPGKIFDEVEARSQVSGFAAARAQAEAQVAGAPYDLTAIYRALSKLLELTDEAASSLQALEIRIEIENAIPVAENMAAVADGDILISDMYLGAATIRELLDKAGLTKNVSLIVSSDGKHSGRIWPQVLKGVNVREHLGDNIHSDVVMPKQFGIASRHTGVTAPTGVERTLLEIGLVDLATICREVRLSLCSGDAEIRALQLAQTNHNLPILVISSLLLKRFARKVGAKSILFSSRDCNMWLPIFRGVNSSDGSDIAAEYFFTSRMSRINPSPEYLSYASKAIGAASIVVDICGTGWSLAHLFQKIGRRDQNVAFLHKLSPRADYEQVARTPQTGRFHQLLADIDGCNNTAIEMCNYASHGMVSDIRLVADFPVPVFAEDRRSPRTHAAIEAQQAAARVLLKVLRERPLRETLSLNDPSLAMVGGALYKGLAQNHSVYLRYLEEHNAEDLATRQKLAGDPRP